MNVNTVLNGDCLDVMKELPDNSIDTIITDPPYGLSFMGKNWDHGIPGIAYWREALRVAKPGATLMAFGGTRTFHRLTCAIEDAGWEIRDCINYLNDGSHQENAFLASLDEEQLAAYMELHKPQNVMFWNYGSGFPKSANVSKLLDKTAIADCPDCEWIGDCDNCGDRVAVYPVLHYFCKVCQSKTVENVRRQCDTCNGTGKVKGMVRDVVGKSYIGGFGSKGQHKGYSRPNQSKDKYYSGIPITAPASPLAKEFDGYGSALKPSFEPIILAQKKLDGTYADNAEKWGVSGLWIDGGRVDANGEENLQRPQRNGHGNTGGWANYSQPEGIYGTPKGQGRYPANTITDGSEDVEKEFAKAGVSVSSDRPRLNSNDGKMYTCYGNFGNIVTSGVSDQGTPSRFFQQCPPDPIENEPEEPKGRYPANTITDGSEDVEKEFAKAGSSPSSARSKSNGKVYLINNNVFGQREPTAFNSSHTDSGSASRYFQQCPPDPTQHPDAARFKYNAKAPKSERSTKGNNHPTQKPLSLIRYLCKLTRTPSGGIVLDPFAGSGTTALAAIAENRDFILIEKEPEYVEICKRRIAEYSGETIEEKEIELEDTTVKQMALW